MSGPDPYWDDKVRFEFTVRVPASNIPWDNLTDLVSEWLAAYRCESLGMRMGGALTGARLNPKEDTPS